MRDRLCGLPVLEEAGGGKFNAKTGEAEKGEEGCFKKSAGTSKKEPAPEKPAATCENHQQAAA